MQWLINCLSRERIPFWDLEWVDPLTVRFRIFPRDLQAVTAFAEQEQCHLQSASRMGILYTCAGLLRRIGLWSMILMTGISLCALPKFLLFYEVVGNETIDDSAILRELENLGIGVGTYGPDIKPRWIKDHILNTLPELQWITVTQNGCRATVVVRERPKTPQTLDRKGYAHVFATQSGMITSQQILAGQPLKQVGDFVLEGEMLVSGLVDLERVFTMEYAQAEIYARTWRKKTVVTPDTVLQTTSADRMLRCIWLEIGKKRIKIFGNSGISTAACDKMINRKILSLPDGLTLPISILTETFVPWMAEEKVVDPSEAALRLQACTEEQVCADIVAGSILSHSVDFSEDVGCYRLCSVLECQEMIAETVEAKWNKEDFIDD